MCVKGRVITDKYLNSPKRSLLCAATLECIEPTSSMLHCNPNLIGLIGVCHRQDQSVFNILNVNSEYEHWIENKGIFGNLLLSFFL